MAHIKRKYLITHPWINFSYDFGQLNYRSWLLLGEAKSKCAHIIGAPLLPEVMAHFLRVYLVKGVLATTAIEGNTLSESEVARRIDGKLNLPPSKEYLGQEIDNILKAVNQIGNGILQDAPIDFSRAEIDNYNKQIFNNLPLTEGFIPGKIRDYDVTVARYRAVPHEDCEYLLEKYISWLNNDFRFPEDDRVIYGILKAVLSHLYFVWIHPYGDGNGRTARLIEFKILLSVGVPSVAAHLLSNHYNMTRVEYYRNLDLASKSVENIQGFILYALQGFVDGLKNEIDQIQEQQLTVHWINHVHNTFKGKRRVEDERKKDLVLDMALNKNIPVPMENIKYISPRITEKYAKLSEKTLQRDVEQLMQMGLIIKSGKEYMCNWEILKPLLPPVRR